MQIRRLDVSHFRGIKTLGWHLPAGRPFVALIGPGDSGKSTILTAVDMALTDRWNLSVNDTDFFNADTTQPISIQVTLSDLPASVRNHDVLGLRLGGIDDNGNLYEDPEEHHQPCVVIALTIGQDLEPKWTIHRPGKESDPLPVSSAARRLIGAYKVDERIDAHLRWSRTSALGRLTEAKHGTAALLASATRTAREAVTAAIPSELAQLTGTIQAKLNSIGSGTFSNLGAGLDQSLSNANGNLALFEGAIPLTGYGLGSRRLAGIATQQLAHEGDAVLLIDEIEYGLEPHRLIGLLGQLRPSQDQPHVVATTHSPTALQYLNVEDLAIVRDHGGTGAHTVQSFHDDVEEVQKLLRSAPAAFLARQILICEGKTEYGIALEVLERADRSRAQNGLPSSAALGVLPVEARSGGSGAVTWARDLRKVGYGVVLFIDSDTAKTASDADSLTAQGVAVVRWQNTFNTEQAACAALDPTGLTALIEASIRLADHPDQAPSNRLDELRRHGLPGIDTLDVTAWTDVAIEKARQVISDAAHGCSWYKRVDKGRVLAQIILQSAQLAGSETETRLKSLRAAVYGTSGSTVSSS